ncbi:hypothetical protein HPB48_000537 [Haemaphysalis longicornis]|uniref:Uncharacterized protein n=1 Tax=Haemaphysalis longicornis TaxID=44386 RepID=A0A9J6GKT3_HAELO|nr:hypothetical protein HPB48_000537 [Haemaphysalis longicornis]
MVPFCLGASQASLRSTRPWRVGRQPRRPPPLEAGPSPPFSRRCSDVGGGGDKEERTEGIEVTLGATVLPFGRSRRSNPKARPSQEPARCQRFLPRTTPRARRATGPAQTPLPNGSLQLELS